MRVKHFFLCCITLAVLSGCEKEASSLDYGTPLIYMPQSMQSGTDIIYNVPSGLDSATYNYVIDTPESKLNIVLGILRSGKTANNGFSVAILTNPDTVTAAIANGSLVGSPDPGDSIVLLPSAAYSLPPTVAVPSGSNQVTFYLSVDITQLKAYAGKKVALAVYLDKPSTYELSPTNAETIVVIDINALKL
jgi:hypothetical protein